MNHFTTKNRLARVAMTLLIALLGSVTGAWAQQDLPYEYGFENNNLAAEGWTTRYSSGNTPGITSALCRTGIYSFVFTSYYSASDYNQYLISPELDATTDFDVSFYYRTDNGSGGSGSETFKVGYSSTTNDPDAFTWGDKISTSTTDWTLFEETFPAGTKYVAVHYYSNFQYYLLVDDFVFEKHSDYAKPTDLTVSYLTNNSATISWTAPTTTGTPTGYAYQFKKASEENWSAEATVTNTSVSLSELTSATTYKFRVKAKYNESDESAYATVNFKTECPETYSIPYAYGFENTDDIGCWTVDGNANIDTQDAAFAHIGNSFFLFSYTTNPPQYLISPQLSGIKNGLHVEFYYRQYTSGVETFKVGYSTTDDPASFTWGNEITASTSYQRFSANYPADTKYVAIQHTSDNQYYLFIDDVLFEESASCLEPSGLAISNETTTGATLSWTAGSDETTWDIYVTDDLNKMPDETTTPTYANVTTKPYDLTGLTPCTIYYAYVRAVKGLDKSAWSSAVIFHTECEPIALPYSYDFEGGSLPVSWNTINTNTSYNTIRVMDADSGVLSFYRESSYGDMIAVLPEVAAAYPLNGYQITFDACYANGNNTSMTSGKLGIGIISDPEDISTFELIEEVDITDGFSTFGSHTVWLNSYTGTGRYIAIKNIYTQNGYVLVDNVAVTELPAVLPPTNLAVANLTEASAELSWTANNGEAEWNVYYKKSADTDYSEKTGVTKNPYTLTGLEAFTSYDFYVVAVSSSGTSAPSEVKSFKTKAAAIASFPWTEDFNGLTVASSIPDGWDNSEGTIPDSSPAYKWCYNTNTSGNGAATGTSHDDSNCVRFNSYNPSSGQINFLKTVPLALPSTQGMQLTFWYKNPTGGDFSVYISTDGGATHETALATGLTGASDWTKIDPINLSTYAGQTVVIVFKGTSNYGNGDAYIYLDDVTVDELPVDITLADTDDSSENSQIVSDYDGHLANVTLSGRTLYTDGYWNTLCLPFSLSASQIASSPLANATIMELDTDESGFEDGTLTLNFATASNITAGTPYIIKWNVTSYDANGRMIINNSKDWDMFAAKVNGGQTTLNAVLNADITGVKTMVGTESYPYAGNFDGNGHTLSLSLTATEAIAAPFRYIDDATIHDVTIAGTINNSKRQNAGVAGLSHGTVTISNCVVSTSITSSYSGDSSNGGFIAHIDDGKVTFNNCAFTGSLLGASATCFGGFVGWRSATTIPIVFNHCYLNPAEVTMSTTGSSTFNRNGSDGNTYDCYYVTAYGDVQGTRTSATGSALQALLGNGWEVSGDNVVPKFTTNAVTVDENIAPVAYATIVDPVFTYVTISDEEHPATIEVSGTKSVVFKGTYDYMSFANEDRSILFLGDENTLYWPQPDGNTYPSIGACRAYFKLNGLSAGEINATRLFFGGEVEETTSLPQPLQREGSQAGAWYTLDGRKLDGKPAKKGVFINNGRKVVIK
jgi:hypothetical protein